MSETVWSKCRSVAISVKSGFTLLELMVVIGIVAMLTAVFMSGIFGANESANQAKCLVNLRNLFAAVDARAQRDHYYPAAGSHEYVDLDNDGEHYYQHKGWISWMSGNAYKNGPNTSCASASWNLSCYGKGEETYTAITNGTIWKTSNGNLSAYVCPTHRATLKKTAHATPAWSYVMNSYFKYDAYNCNGFIGSYYLREYGHVTAPAKTLLFAEIPFLNDSVQKAPAPSGASGNPALDCTLQYDDGIWKGTPESIGFNHKVDERSVCAHVVFADGHTEKLLRPGKEENLVKITKWLCEGTDWVYVNNIYKEAGDAN